MSPRNTVPTLPTSPSMACSPSDICIQQRAVGRARKVEKPQQGREGTRASVVLQVCRGLIMDIPTHLLGNDFKDAAKARI